MKSIYPRCMVIVTAMMLVACNSDSGTPGASDDTSPDVQAEVEEDAGVSVESDGTQVLGDEGSPEPEETVEGPSTSDGGPEQTPDAGPDEGELPTEEVDDGDQSGWPSNPDKDSIPDPGWDSVPGVGTVMPNFTAIDQYGNQVELYDFAGQGVPVVIDVGTWFCEPCKALAAYLSDGDPSPMYEDNDDDGKADFLWWNESYEVVYDLVNNGELIWITVLYSLGDPVTPEDAHLWHEEWPHPLIPVLADETLQLQEYLDVGAMPRIDVLSENMVFEVFETKGPSTGMKYISALP